MSAAITQSDALALAMLAVLALSFGCVLLLLVAIYRRGKAAECEVQKLIDEVGEDEARTPETAGSSGDEPKPEAWEREADWWRKG